jgi:hypothetical protein
MMTAPDTASRGWITITGGRQITIEGNNFRRGSVNPPATSTPLVWVGPNVGANQVKWGLNNAVGYGGVPARIAQATTGKIVNIDPSVPLDVAA